MKTVLLDSEYVKVLQKTTIMLEQKLLGTEFEVKEIPLWLPNGEEISTMEQMAAMLNTDTKTAAFCVIDSKNAPRHLVKQALLETKADHVRTPAGSRKFGLPIGAIIVDKGENELTNVRLRIPQPDKKTGVAKPEYYAGADNQRYTVTKKGKDFVVTNITDAEKPEIVSTQINEDDALKWIDEISKHPNAALERGNRKPPRGYDYATPEQRTEYAVPPAWVDVFVAKNPNANRIIIARDGKDRPQAKYSKKHSDSASVDKFKRNRELQKHIKKLDAQIQKDLFEKEEANALLLIRVLGMRAGGDNELANVKAYGTCTLEARHFTLNKDSVTFNFIGKKGVQIHLNTKDDDIRILMEMFQESGLTGHDRLFPNMTPSKLGAYMRQSVPSKFLIKDLRTLKANELALQKVSVNKKKFKTEKDFRAFVNSVGEDVSKVLGNSRNMALQSYVEPYVFKDVATDPEWFENYLNWATKTKKEVVE